MTPHNRPTETPDMTKDRVMMAVAIATGFSTVAISMALNVWAFTEQMPGIFGTMIGLALPIWVLALTFAGEWAGQKHRVMGLAAYALAGFLLVVSLPHLAHGFDKITGGRWWESWSLALVTDICQVVMKMVVIAIAKSGRLQAKPKAEKTPKKAGKKAPIKLASEEVA